MGDIFFETGVGNSLFSRDDFTRSILHCDNLCSRLIDSHDKGSVTINFFRIRIAHSPMDISCPMIGEVMELINCCDSGILLRVIHDNRQYTIWISSTYWQYKIDDHKRICGANRSFLSYKFQYTPRAQMVILVNGNLEDTIVIPYIVLDDPDAKFFDEIKNLSTIEKRLYRKSEWFFANRPSSLWEYFINGSIYDPRSHTGIGKRFKCQQCAYSWWNYFGFLHRETGKRLYDILQNEIAYSVLLDLSENGEWGHGYWSEIVETHSRFHLDGIHLLISQFYKTGDFIWLEAGERAMSFVIKNLVDNFEDNGAWFLHDTIEDIQKHHFKSNVFGKSVFNSLCLNTHLQALTVLYRLNSILPNNGFYSELQKNGLIAMKRVLEHRPQDTIYRILMYFMMKYKTKGKSNLIKRNVKKAVMRVLPDLLWLVRRKFPRLVYPGGFIERDLTLSFFSDSYHLINVKDLLTLYQMNQDPWLRTYIIDAMSFISEYLKEISLKDALESSPFYIELTDIYDMYDRLIEPIEKEEISKVERIIYKNTGGYSLDYFSSSLVRGG